MLIELGALMKFLLAAMPRRLLNARYRLLAVIVCRPWSCGKTEKRDYLPLFPTWWFGGDSNSLLLLSNRIGRCTRKRVTVSIAGYLLLVSLRYASFEVNIPNNCDSARLNTQGIKYVVQIRVTCEDQGEFIMIVTHSHQWLIAVNTGTSNSVAWADNVNTAFTLASRIAHYHPGQFPTLLLTTHLRLIL